MQWWMWVALGLGFFYMGWMVLRSHRNDGFDPWKDPKATGSGQPSRRVARRRPPAK